MYASWRWLRELVGFDADARRVADALTARGLTVDGVTPFGDDWQIEIDVPANRPDCLGHRGLAREVAAALDLPYDPPAPAVAGDGPAVERSIAVEIADPDLCGRYTACIVRGVRVGPSSDAVAKRLEVCGVRAISNVVDASNLVMLETGNPIHFFDLPTVSGARIVVRRARAGETLVTLDGQERTLDEEMLVIADADRAVALAGVMGGAATEIGDATRDVLIEAAWFAPDSIRRTARQVGLHTDASHRFERGADPAGVLAAQETAVRLLVETAGGTADAGVVDACPMDLAAPELTVRAAEVERLLGYRPEDAEAETALRALALAPRAAGDGAWTVSVPSWRVDLEREADLVEEIARHLGYDRIPTSMSGLPTVDTAAAAVDAAERARDPLARAGFREAFGYAMIAENEDAPFVEPGTAPATALDHPIVETMAYLRRSMLPGLLRAAELNQRRGAADLRLFEVGKVFHPREGETFPHEPVRAGIVWYGRSRPPHWSGPAPDVDLYDLTAVVEELLAHLAPGVELARRAGALPGYHPGLSATWLRDGEAVAWAGALHPERAGGFSQRVWIAEVDAERLEPGRREPAAYRRLPKLGAVERDLAVVLPPDRTWAELHHALADVEAPVPVSIDVVDRYAGPPLAEGSVALTVRFRLQPEETSLTEETIETFRTRMIERITGPLGLEIRS